MSNRLIIILLFALSLGSCEKTWIEKNIEKSSQEILTELWTEVDENYVFFDQKSIDWNDSFSNHFNSLTGSETDEELFDILASLISDLKDGHSSLYAGFNTWKYYDLYLNTPSNYNQNFVESTYLGTPSTIGPFTYSILNDNIAYIHYASFGDNFSEDELQYLFDFMNTSSTGLILDLRNNQGGALDNALGLMSVFVENDETVGEIYYPKLDGRLDEGTNLTVSPNKNGTYYENKTVLLTNRKSYSACSVFTGFMKGKENITIVGDTTGGGSGLAAATVLSNGWQYRYSAGKITLPNGEEMENGVAPDEYVSTGTADELNGEDALIERALEILN
ncbi:MAG: hypothetical protein GQ574_10955 [Crocinitomix sp.]|nr:hypothetical protein [Crocinitomix sp.]